MVGLIVILVLLLAVLAGVGYVKYLQKKELDEEVKEVENSTPITELKKETVVRIFITYSSKDSAFHLSDIVTDPVEIFYTQKGDKKSVTVPERKQVVKLDKQGAVSDVYADDIVYPSENFRYTFVYEAPVKSKK